MNKNIVITGGELFNKGAQSMTFTVIDEMKKRYPNKDIYLMSMRDYNRSEEEKNKFDFNFIPIDGYSLLRINHPYLRPLIKEKNISRNEEKKITDVLENAVFAIDISGYNLSSQFNPKKSYIYLLRIKMFKKYNIPVYIFPQSIGPFDYKFPYNLFLKRMIKNVFSYPEIIYPREFHGYKLLKNMDLDNIQKNIDTVFYQNDIDLNNIFVYDWQPNTPEIKDNSVAIVPNSKIIKYNANNNIDTMYKKILNYLLDIDKNVYIIRHSMEDLDFCKRIYKLVDYDESVHLLKNNFNAIELYRILGKFDYIVGSRYHSIVHSYKNSVPALIIGWSIKYKELSQLFNQENYVFDIRTSINIDDVILMMNELNNYYKEESEVIAKEIKSIKKDNIFDFIKNRYPVRKGNQ